jgi:hypothetical protein
MVALRDRPDDRDEEAEGDVTLRNRAAVLSARSTAAKLRRIRETSRRGW